MREQKYSCILFSALCLTLFVSCSHPELGGGWEGAAGQTLYLSDGDCRIDSAVVDAKGRFAFAFQSDSARICTLTAGDASWPVYLDGTRTEIAVKAELEGGLRFELVEGGQEQRVMRNVAKVLEDNKAFQRMTRQAFESQTLPNPGFFKTLFGRVDSTRKAIDAEAAALLDTTASSGASMAIIADYYLGDMLQLAKAKDAFARVDSVLYGTPVWRQTAAKLECITSVFPGGEAPDIALPSPQGDTLRLSSLRGKWVLLDFWASWCVPCMHEMPMLRDLYASFRDKGLEIYGVSSDTRAENWKDAIIRDRLVWQQVSGLDGGGTQVVHNRYMVNAIPCILLIDPQGRVVSRGQRGDRLRQEVMQQFLTENNP